MRDESHGGQRIVSEKERLRALLTEEIAKLEHEQWIIWSATVVNKIANAKSLEEVGKITFERWDVDWTSWRKLDEREKEKNREWARKVVRLLFDTEYFKVLGIT